MIAQQARMREDFSITIAFIGLSTLFVLVFLTSVLTHWSPLLESWIDGRPTLIVSNGGFLSVNMNIVRLSNEEVYAEMHQAGLSKIDQVKWTLLETDEKTAISPTSARKPRSSRPGAKIRWPGQEE